MISNVLFLEKGLNLFIAHGLMRLQCLGEEIGVHLILCPTYGLPKAKACGLEGTASRLQVTQKRDGDIQENIGAISTCSPHCPTLARKTAWSHKKSILLSLQSAAYSS